MRILHGLFHRTRAFREGPTAHLFFSSFFILPLFLVIFFILLSLGRLQIFSIVNLALMTILSHKLLEMLTYLKFLKVKQRSHS